MRKNVHLIVLAVAGFVACWFACSRIDDSRIITAKALEMRFDFSELTPLEVKRIEKVLNAEVSPCGDDVTLAESLFNPDHCPLAPLAGRFVMKKIMEDYNQEEIATAYMKRYAAIAGLEISEDGSPRMGAANPSVTLVVFTDFECPFCAKAASELHHLVRRYPEDIALVHKNLPLAKIHKNAEMSAKAAFAAHRQEKFWQMHDTIFSASGSLLTRERLEITAQGLGLDLEQFKEDMDSTAAQAALAADRKLAKQLGVDSTPTFFINGRRIEKGLSALDERVYEEFLRHGKKL
ncbi:MAG: thioredoxin domain-containing protein [Myxococcota bacterium]|nr:thioredoxin domain-containing protein [Myxococcota bacterium]